MTIKTGTGIKRFQDSQGYGKWFLTLFAVVKTRESCQPHEAIDHHYHHHHALHCLK